MSNYLAPSAWTPGGPATAFSAAIIAHVGDDVIFKLLCDAFPGMLFIFVSTVSPVLLAITLALVTTIVRRHARFGSEQCTPTSKPCPAADLDSSSSFCRFVPLWLRPTRAHAAIALLGQLVTVLVTAGGPNTPGHAQVIINQSKLAFTAVISYLALGRRYSRFQIVAAVVIVFGSALVSAGALSEEKGSSEGQSSDDDGGGGGDKIVLLSRTASIVLFFCAQIPSALAAVWRERILKMDEEGDDKLPKNENVPTHLKILQLATLLGIMRAALALCFGAAAALASPSIATSMRVGLSHLKSNQHDGAFLLLMNTLTWVTAKLTILWVSVGRGGAFLSCIAAAIALPVEVVTFCTVTAERPTAVAWLGVILSFVGMVLYLKAAPHEFTSRDRFSPTYEATDDDEESEFTSHDQISPTYGAIDDDEELFETATTLYMT